MIRPILAAAAGLTLAAASPAFAGTATLTFSTAGHHAFVVPQGVTSLQVTLAGERGGGLLGGAGALASGTRAVGAGQSYDVVIGTGRGAGAFAGGGATELRATDRILVAAGGGGMGGGLADVLGGAGGAAGTPLTPAGDGSAALAGGPGGRGATANAGGTGGGGGEDGSAGQGGAGEPAQSFAGGGGGGGVYGGEGGGASPSVVSGAGGGGGGMSGSTGAWSGLQWDFNASGAAYALIAYTESVPPAPAIDALTRVADRRPVFSGMAGSDTGDDATVKLAVYAGTTPVTSALAAVTDGEWSGSLATSLPDGDYTLKVTQGDAAGNNGTATRAFTVDATGPRIDAQSGAVYAQGESVEPHFTCSDPAGVTACDGPDRLDTATPGTHGFTVTARDALGNASSATFSYAVAGPAAAPAASPPVVVGTILPGPVTPQIVLRATKLGRCTKTRCPVTLTGIATDRVAVRAVHGRTVKRAMAKRDAFSVKLSLPRLSKRATWTLTLAVPGAKSVKTTVRLPAR